MYRSLNMAELGRLRAEMKRAREGLERDGFRVMGMSQAEHARAAHALHDQLLVEHRARMAPKHTPESDELTHAERIVALHFGRSKAHMINARSKR